MKDSYSGSYTDIVGGEDISTTTLRTIYDLRGADIQKGKTYSFRYRVYNVNGWSVFSDVLAVVAADVPS